MLLCPMGSFRDLPKDVVWIIFRLVISNRQFGSRAYEVGSSCSTLFNPPPFLASHYVVLKPTVDLALVSKDTLRLIQQKTRRVDDGGWLFVKGALSS